MSVSVRAAESKDVPWLLDQLREFDKFTCMKRPLFPIDDEEAAATVYDLVTNHLFLVAVEGNNSLGFIAGILAPHYFNHDLITLTELMWWVDPQYRGTSAGAKLFHKFMEIGREHADWIVVALESNSPVNKDALTSRGFVLHEQSFLFEVK